jgi:hypothetical protein
LTFNLTIDYDKIYLKALEIDLIKELKIAEPIEKWSTFSSWVVRGDGIIILE